MADDDLPSDVLYHPVKTLGRGAFGEAVLYRRVEVNVEHVYICSSVCGRVLDLI